MVDRQWLYPETCHWTICPKAIRFVTDNIVTNVFLSNYLLFIFMYWYEYVDFIFIYNSYLCSNTLIFGFQNITFRHLFCFEHFNILISETI